MRRPTTTKALIEKAVWDLIPFTYDIFTTTPVVVAAIRGFHLDMGAAAKNDRGIYDDAFFVICGEEMVGFPGNTDPSRYREGIAFVEGNQLIWYKPGWHGYGKPSGHPAFRQDSRIVVRRDGGRGPGISLGDGRFRDTDRSPFWCNNHAGGDNTTSSLGCLTLPKTDIWPAYYQLIMAKLKVHNQKRFPLFLIDAPKIPWKRLF